MIVEIPVLKFLTAFAHVRPTIPGRTGHKSLLAFLLNICYLLDFRPFRAHQFWASVAKGWAGGRPRVGGWGERRQQHVMKKCPE